MIILDTNVISEPLRAHPAPSVAAWAQTLADKRVCTTAVTVGELAYGIARLPEGRRKQGLAAGVAAALTALGPGGVIPYDNTAAELVGAIIIEREHAGHPIQQADAQIAAICRATGATLATRNTPDFEGLGLVIINPWDA
ncbi:MAG: type II toxin-antitoxin system VapC family toxin [Propionibacteriaceae bacterium]|nr:type II toxin-antitoxin system VapC family toxin [Propionibacteriaceae bacterium]